jgi:hypothetical protein
MTGAAAATLAFLAVLLVVTYHDVMVLGVPYAFALDAALVDKIARMVR